MAAAKKNISLQSGHIYSPTQPVSIVSPPALSAHLPCQSSCLLSFLMSIILKCFPNQHNLVKSIGIRERIKLCVLFNFKNVSSTTKRQPPRSNIIKLKNEKWTILLVCLCSCSLIYWNVLKWSHSMQESSNKSILSKFENL